MARSTEESTAREEAKDIVDEEFAGLTDGDVENVGSGDDTGIEDDDEEDLDDDDLDDDDDEDDDEEDEGDPLDELLGNGAEGAAGGATAGVDRGDGRDTAGKFAKEAAAKATADAAAAGGAAAAGTANAAPAAGGTAAAPAAAAAPLKFEPLKIKADKVDVEIPEAQITRASGHTIFTVKDADANRFLSRISRGVVAEKVWRDMDTMRKELEAERTAPARKSETEIEAEMTLEVLKPFLAEILTPEQVENLDLKVKLAKSEYATTYDADRRKHIETTVNKVDPEQQQQEEQEQTLRGLADHLIAFRDHEQLRDLTDDELRRAYKELAPFQRSVFWKEGDGYFANNQLIAQRLLAIKQGRSAATTETGAPAKATTATTDAKPTDSAATAKGERFNAGVDSATKPKTTSLKANRGSTGNRSRDERNTRRAERAREREAVDTPAQKAEDDWRKEVNDFMRSPGLDFGTE